MVAATSIFKSLAQLSLILIVGTPCFAQKATVLRASGPAEVLTDPQSIARQEEAQTLYEGKYYKTQKARIGLRLKDSVIIRTGSGGKVTLAYQNGDMFTISENSFYRILAVGLNDGKSVTELIQGAVRGHIKKDGPLSGSEVKTSTLVMGVRGTDYYVARPGKAGDTEVVVIRGAVAVSAPKQTAKPIEVAAGQSTFSAPPQSVSENGTGPDSVAEAFPVAKADKATLATIQTETSVSPASVAIKQIPESEQAAVRELEQRAADNILSDIKNESPEVYAAIVKDSASGLYGLNTAAVETLYASAPEPAGDAGRVQEREVLFAKLPPPEAPALLRPFADPGHAAISAGPVTFAWDASAGAVGYELEVSENMTFSNPKFSARTAERQFSVVMTSGIYWWKVRAYDAQGRNGVWSAVQKFSVASGSAPEVENKELDDPESEVPQEKKKDANENLSNQEEKTNEPPDRFLAHLGLGGGSYSYNYEKNGFFHNRKASGGGVELTAYAMWTPAIFTSFSFGSLGMDDFLQEGETQRYGGLRASGMYLFDSGLPVKFGAGVGFSKNDLVQPRETGMDVTQHSLEALYADLSLLSTNWPKSFFLTQIGLGVVSGSSDVDVRKDSTIYARVRYQRQFFRFPLSLGASTEYFSQTMQIHNKENDGVATYRFKRQPVFFEAGYSL